MKMTKYDLPRRRLLTNYEQMLISAVRYALGRRTYIVGTTCEYVLQELPKLSKECVKIMIMDIKKQGELGYGYECDRTDWIQLLHKLEMAKSNAVTTGRR